MCMTPEAYKGSALKGGQYPLGYIRPYHLSTSLPIHHHGGHLPQQPYPCMCNWGLCHTRHWRGSGCRKVQSDTRAELAYDSVEGSTYVIGAWTATVSRMLART